MIQKQYIQRKIYTAHKIYKDIQWWNSVLLNRNFITRAVLENTRI